MCVIGDCELNSSNRWPRCLGRTDDLEILEMDKARQYLKHLNSALFRGRWGLILKP